MSDANVINFALLVVTAIAAVVSLIAVVDARKSRSDAEGEAAAAERSANRSATAAEGIEAAMNRTADAQKRMRRSELARDLIIWFDRSTVLMVLGGDASILDSDWVEAGTALNARARVIDSAGATGLIQAAKRARSAVEQIDPERRIDAAFGATRMLQLWAEQWVEDGEEHPYPIEEWIRTDDETLRDEN